MTNEQIEHMVSRFLQWKLPENFNPDAGIEFHPAGIPKWPLGTNLFDAQHAEAMVRHMVEGLPSASTQPDFWTRIRDDKRMENARRKLSMDELRTLFQHARDSLASPPFPDGETVKLTTDIVPYSSIVGGGLMLKKMDGRAGFIVNFIGTTEGITKEETAALSAQFAWLIHTYGCRVPKRPDPAASSE